MAKKVQIKLTIELIPKTCHYSNVRSSLSKKEWDKIRFISYENANYVCEICSQTGLEQGYRHKLECHEIWKYDDKKKIQKLVGLISLCPLCHQVKHIGRANAMGKQADVFKQLETINNWDHKQVVQHVAEAFEEYKERSNYEWKLDISLLKKSPYNLLIQETVKRKFDKPKFKRRKTKRSKRKL
jgi:hypothetical protein